MEWYFEILIGIFAGVYVSSPKFRHVINYLLIALLKGIMWCFKVSDQYHKESPPRVVYITKEVKKSAQPTVEPVSEVNPLKGKSGKLAMSTDELENLMSKNPDLKVSEKK